MDKIKYIKILKSYTVFKKNVLYLIDNRYWDNDCEYIINQNCFNKILTLLEELCKTNINDAVIYSFMNFKGIGILKDI